MENNEDIITTEEEISTEEVNEETASGAETTENNEGDTVDWKAQALKYKAIAERREKKLQNTNQEKEKETNNTVPESILDEVYLAAEGVSKEEVAQLKIIAKGKGISLTEARKDPMFEALKKARDVDTSHKNSQLGASYAGNATTDQTGSSGADRQKRYQEIIQRQKK